MENINALVIQLETKQGCPLMDALKDMPFENQIKALREIEDRAKNNFETNLTFSRNRFKDNQMPEISIHNLGDEIFQTSIGLHTGRVSMSCKDEIRKYSDSF